MEQEDFMLIRIRRRDSKCKETEMAVSEVIVTDSIYHIKGML
jgi:hypothetical protein